MEDQTRLISTKLEEFKAAVDKRDADIASLKSDLQAVMARVAQGNTPAGRESVAQKFAASYVSVQEQVKAALKSGASHFRWEPGISARDYFSKSFVGVAGGSSPDTDYPPLIERRPGIVDQPLPATIFDALPVIQISSNIYEYVQFLSTESHNNAAIVAEGNAKPYSQVNFQKQQASPIVFAHLSKFSNQLQQDNPEVTGVFIPNRLRKWLLQKIDAEVLNGPGGAGRIEGLYTAAAALSVTGQPNDRIGSGVSQMRALGYNPSVVILANSDAFAIESERATTGDGQYVSGGVKFGGLPTVRSPNATVNEALIIDASTVAILEREAPSFQVGLDGSDWSLNLWSGRSEARLSAAIFDLGGVRKVALS